MTLKTTMYSLLPSKKQARPLKQTKSKVKTKKSKKNGSKAAKVTALVMWQTVH